MDTIIGRRLEGERVVVSGAHFERCVFVDCELVFDGRSTHLVDNTFDGCRWSFEGAAATTLDLLTVLCRDSPGLVDVIAREMGLPIPVPAGLMH
jgi:hypothetical protein